VVNRGLGALGLAKRPGKTVIGRIGKGCDFLGCHFGPEGLKVAKATVGKFVARATPLYALRAGAGGARRLRPAWQVAVGQGGFGERGGAPGGLTRRTYLMLAPPPLGAPATVADHK
jgi:hypothetical protein